MQILEFYIGLTFLIFALSLLLSFLALFEYWERNPLGRKSKTNLQENIRNSILVLMGMQVIIFLSFLINCLWEIPLSIAHVAFQSSSFLLLFFGFGTFLGLFYLVSGITVLIDKRKSLRKEDL